MMTSEEMTKRVLERLSRHRERIRRRNELIRLLTFGLVEVGGADLVSHTDCETEYRKGKAMSTKRSTAITALSMAFVIGAVITTTALITGRNAPEDMTDDPSANVPEVSVDMSENGIPNDMNNNVEEPADEPVEESTEPVYYPLELRESEMRHYTDEELWAIQDKAREDYAENGPRLIDRSHYLKYFEDGGDMNCIEAKSYIIHMMVNSVDYFNTVSGELTIYAKGPTSEGSSEYSFRADTEAQFSYFRREDLMTQPDIHTVSEYYHHDDNDFTDIDSEAMTYRTNRNYVMPDMALSINDFLTVGESGSTVFSGRPDRLNLGRLVTYFHPQDVAFSRLGDFDSWTVTGVEDYIGYRCAVIEGQSSVSFKMYLDLEHGIILKINEDQPYLTEEVTFTSLEIDGEVDTTPFDTTGYEEIIDKLS